MANVEELLKLLEAHGIQYQRIDHVPLFTTQQAEEVMGDVPGIPSKNLFLEDNLGGLWLLATTDKKRVDLKALAGLCAIKKFSFASAEKLRTYLGVEPGAVTLFGAINDPEGKVTVMIDADIIKSEMVQCHPLINTATLLVAVKQLLKFFELVGHGFKEIEVPIK